MSWNFFEIFEVITDFLGFLGSLSSDVSDDGKVKIKKKIKYFTEKLSSGLVLVSAILLFFVFKDPLPPENYVQTLIVISLIGLAVSLVSFFVLYILGKYYFKSVFQWLFFSCSVVLFFISVVLCVYFKSGIFV
ncbi:branched-chain amino acid ABC transporter substrate-binding protein [Chryseobacterium sp. JJR-5R]|uniref:branched-chain amino acid ABC transporter substrate-binding protein n=1 Tax=Chryseobacterium sp. JJR-5R TaxID=3093923 RepID=UPI002A764FFA|nr:branched-chain amino acid ABC transporter substrate-binding protein [Chryseobacterium sp. JJR-5R]WPO83866.1 branched-chain amino acid ABC transporter substrate-binding protein [Chryseobacterium sp. JJR-5R]